MLQTCSYKWTCPNQNFGRLQIILMLAQTKICLNQASTLALADLSVKLGYTCQWTSLKCDLLYHCTPKYIKNIKPQVHLKLTANYIIIILSAWDNLLCYNFHTTHFCHPHYFSFLKLLITLSISLRIPETTDGVTCCSTEEYHNPSSFGPLLLYHNQMTRAIARTYKPQS